MQQRNSGIQDEAGLAANEDGFGRRWRMECESAGVAVADALWCAIPGYAGAVLRAHIWRYIRWC
jgi:hypothetical protein